MGSFYSRLSTIYLFVDSKFLKERIASLLAQFGSSCTECALGRPYRDFMNVKVAYVNLEKRLSLRMKKDGDVMGRLRLT